MTFADAFSAAKAEGRALLLPYLMAGVPDLAGSVNLLAAMAEAGADGFEVGIPYADPVMDGPVIQEAGRRALEAGTTLQAGIAVAAEVVEVTGLPCLVMTYVNPILHRGVERFCAEVAAAGVEGIIVADLPLDESGPIRDTAAGHGLGMVPLVAPTTPDHRLEKAAAGRPPFVYAVADLGVTGERAEASPRAADLVARVRRVTDLPVGLGVGISTPDQAAAAASLADAVIVGSALVRKVLAADRVEEAEQSLRRAVSELSQAVRP